MSEHKFTEKAHKLRMRLLQRDGNPCDKIREALQEAYEDGTQSTAKNVENLNWPSDEVCRVASQKYASLEEYPNTIWQRQGFMEGVKWLKERIKK